MAYQQKPWLYNEALVNQMKDHAAHFQLEAPKEPERSPEDAKFDLLRGVKGVGEGFISGFTTFQVGEPSENEYERIMRSVGELAGFVGFVPSTPFKLMGAAGLAQAAQKLRGNSVPLWVAKKATNTVAPIVSKTLEKAATAKNSSFADAAKFLTGDVAKHTAEGAFNLGIASSVGAWQFGVNEMLKSGMHGAVTGGVFRGIANLVNRGGIPTLDPRTGNKILDMTQKEDQLIRAGASSLYEGLSSTMRGETTPEIIYSYLLGAFFGAHETTAGESMKLRHIQKVEKASTKKAKDLGRLDPSGKPYQWDTTVFNPEVIEGWDTLPKDVQDAVYKDIALRHGNYGAQAVMAGETIEGVKDAIATDIVISNETGIVKQAQLADFSKKHERFVEVKKVNADDLANQDDVILLPDHVKGFNTDKAIEGNIAKLPLKGMTDEYLNQNREQIREVLEKVPDERKIVVSEDMINELRDSAPETAKYLVNKLGKIASGMEKAEIEMAKRTDNTEKDNETTKVDDTDFESSQVEIDKQARSIVKKYFKAADNITTAELSKFQKESTDKIIDVLNNHTSLDTYEKYIKDVNKAFPEQADFSPEGQKELRQLLIRRAMQRPAPYIDVSVVYDKDSKQYTQPQVVELREMNEKNQAGEIKSVGDSPKAFELAYERVTGEGYNPANRAMLILDEIIHSGGKDSKYWKTVPIDKINDVKSFYGVSNYRNKRLMGGNRSFGRELMKDVLGDLHSKGYYYNGGKGDSAKMYFFKYHPDVVKLDKVGVTREKDRYLNILSKLDPNAKKHYLEMKQEFNSKFNLKLDKLAKDLYFDRAFISNIKWDKVMYGINESVLGKKGFADWLMRNTQIKDAKGFNKRNQIWLTDGFSLDTKFFKKQYAGPTKFKGDKAKFRIFRDTDTKNLTINDRATLYMESTDGAVLAEASFVDALNEAYGLPSSGQNKSFLVDSDPTHGALLGKFMFHKASPEASAWMRKEGIHFLMPESGAKEYGSRAVGALTVDKDGKATFGTGLPDIKVKKVKGITSAYGGRMVGARTDYKNKQILIDEDKIKQDFNKKAWLNPKMKGVDPLPDGVIETPKDLVDFYILHERAHFTKENQNTPKGAERENHANKLAMNALQIKKNKGDLELNLEGIKGSLSEKQSDHMLEPQLIAKQAMSNLHPHASSRIAPETINKFFDEVVTDRYKGDPLFNEQFKIALEKPVGQLSDIEQQRFIDNLDKVGLSEVIDGLKSNHFGFVTKLYQKILRSNLSNLTTEFESGMINSVDYTAAVADAKHINSSLSRMIEIYPDRTVFLHKDVRNYVQSAMRNFVVSKVVRPKWNASMSARMRGLDPWLAKQDNLAIMDLPADKLTKKMKKEYGIENPDELIFLDERYKKVRFDVKDVGITHTKKYITLEELDTPEYRKLPAVKEFFKTISLRVPMDSISGAHRLVFAGFTGVDGHGAVLHPRAMKALGGADLDGDKVSIMFGMKKEFRDMYHLNKKEFMEGDVVKDNKEAKINAAGIKILKETLDPSNPHDKFILDLIKNKKGVTWQDLFTTTTEGDAAELARKTSIVGRFTPGSRLNISQEADAGRKQLGPAIVSKQTLNAAYNALLPSNNNIERYINKKTGRTISKSLFHKKSKAEKANYKPDRRHGIAFDHNGKTKWVYVIPRTSASELKNSRELSRAQIAFGSDPLDEISLTGVEHFYNNAFNSLFKVDWNGNEAAKSSFNPYWNVRQQGVFKIFGDLNSAYFGKNHTEGRRWQSHEIKNMGSGVLWLNEKQRSSMLPRMAEVIQPLDYADDIMRTVDRTALENRYNTFNSDIAVRLKALNDNYKAPGGLLGRPSFVSRDNPIIYKVMDKRLWEADERIRLADESFTNEYIEFFRDLKGARWGTKSALREHLARSFPRHQDYKDFWKSTQELDEAASKAPSYRLRSVTDAYRQGTDFAQSNAMDRVSAIQLLKGIDMARKSGTKDDFIYKMAKAVQNIKDQEMYMKGKALERFLQTEVDRIAKDKNEAVKLNQQIRKVFQKDQEFMPFNRQQKINERIAEFKLNNKIKGTKKKGAKLSPEESYLFDTMMLSTYFKGRRLTEIEAFKNLDGRLKKLIYPQIREMQRANSGTYFYKTGLNSAWVNDAAIGDFFRTYAKEFDEVTTGNLKDFDTKQAVEKQTKTKELREIAPDDPLEDDVSGILEARQRSKEAKESGYALSNAEREMVDELIGHVKYYHNSMKSVDNLNLLARKLRQKNFDAFTVEDYRVMNRFFRDMRSGNIFTTPKGLTKDNILKLGKRHWMLFPKSVSDEMMVKDFKIFEEMGHFQNYKGEWVAGKVGSPTQIIENIQYYLGKTEALSVQLNQDEKLALEKELREVTGYESLPDGIGHHIAGVTNAERSLRAFKSKNIEKNSGEYHHKLKNYQDKLAEAKEAANWDKIKEEKFSVKIYAEDASKPSTITRTGRQIKDTINDVLTERAKTTFSWIRGKNWYWDEPTQSYVKNTEMADPLDQFIVRAKGSKKKLYWGNNKDLPKIDAKAFTKYIETAMKEGTVLDLGLGLDNLRKVQRSITLDKFMAEKALTKDPTKREMYDDLIEMYQKQGMDYTNYFKPTDYHPQFIENKSIAKQAVIEQIERIKKIPDNVMDRQTKEREVAKQINKYRNMTGDWIISDITDSQIELGALREIAEKRKGDHFRWLEQDPIAGNMMSRSSDLPGWSTDIGNWDIYQKNLIDTFYRQIGQIMSKRAITDFTKESAKWNDEGQAFAWNNYVQDYTTRALGFPSKIPQEWMEGPGAELMKVKGTPYSWFADNHVLKMVKRIRKSLGFKEDTRLPEELGLTEQDLRHWSNLEAKYQMATLLAHPKSAVANIFGGTIHTIQSAGWRNWKDGRNVEFWRTNIAGEASKWESKKDIDRWVIKHGVVPDFIIHEAGLNPNFKGGKWKLFLDDAKKVLEKDPAVKDETLLSIAKKHKITETAFQKAAWFMREPERMLRRDAFAAHYLQAREKFGHANMPLDHPMLIEMAKKGVKATQFLYSAPYRPAFSSSALGKVMTRFQTWAWNSVRFRNDTYKQAKLYGFRRGTPEFERFKRQYLTDMFVFGLGNVFAYSLFESAMPAPWNWFQDTADWVFGDEKERDRAFFGQWPTALAPLQMVTPPGLRLVPATFNAFVNDDYSRLSNYHMWTMFPFGRMARDVKGVLENPAMTIEKATGIPYLKLSEEIKGRRIGAIDPLGKRETKKLAKQYPWMQRAVDNPLRTSKNESVRTAVEKHPEHGWIVFPTIRLDGDKLKEYSLKQAMDIALKNKDFIKVESLQEGNRISQGFSKRLTLNEKGE
ncbi:MAG: hypothetical protein Unbinned5179contig1000_13 [Prokaryotic dsDNA virus sp.]|nr:MAG: hypothetical protein Unbinned5179contig1000_13 [Prokaryotic dsDNA virus sp.]